jgi:micrococcal nuclease
VRKLCVALLVLLAASAGCSGPAVHLEHQAPATLQAEPGGYERADVTRVVDGDTIAVVITDRVEGPGAGMAPVGTEQRVRLLGIDTPESVAPGQPVECFGRDASAAAAALLDGEEVLLVRDLEETDHYDRLLRYVYLGEEMANARLVVNGYAHALTYPPNVRHSDLLVMLERAAQEQGRGLWAGDACDGTS